MGKPYRETVYNGVKAHEYENGTILNAETKKIMRPANNTMLTPERVRQYNLEKPTRAMEVAKAGLLRGVSATQLIEDSYFAADHAAELVFAAQTELAMSPDLGHASTKAAEMVLKAAGYIEDRRQKATLTAQDAHGNSVEVSATSAADLLRLADRLYGCDNGDYRKHESTSSVVEAEVTEISGGGASPPTSEER